MILCFCGIKYLFVHPLCFIFQKQKCIKNVKFVEMKNIKTMKGIHFVTNEKNERIAVQIDLDKYSEIWEDFYDVLIAESRKDDETISLDDLKNELKNEGKL